MKTLIPALMLVCLCGCARFKTKQTDISYEAGNTNRPARAITTTVTAYTLWSSKSELARFKATQTDKSQSASVGSLNQQANMDTNVNALVSSIIEGAIRGATR
jgi:hypothetical protein